MEVGGEDLDELLGPLLPSRLVSLILEKKSPLKDQDLPPGELPFDISKHPACRHAERSISRWSEDLAFFRERAAQQTPYGLKMKASGGQWPCCEALQELRDGIGNLKDPAL